MWKNYQNHLPQFALPLLFRKLFFFHLQTPLPTRIIPEKQTTSDPIKYHSRTTRQEGGVPSLPPRPPLISQSKYFSLFSNPDSCKNSSIIIILIIIYKNRSSFSFYFLSFSKCVFFPKQRDLLFGNSVIYIFFSLNVSSGKPTHPLPHPVSLNLVRKNVMFLFEIQNKNNAKNSFVFSYFIFFKDLHLSFTESRLGINKGWFLSTQKKWMNGSPI